MMNMHLSGFEKSSLKLTNIIFEIGSTIKMGSKNNLCLSIDHHLYFSDRRSHGVRRKVRDIATQLVTLYLGEFL